MKLGRAIKIARTRRDLTQSELADELGVSANYISMLERDKRDPSIGFLEKLCEHLAIPLPLLLLLAGADGKSQQHDWLKQMLGNELMGLVISSEPETEQP